MNMKNQKNCNHGVEIDFVRIIKVADSLKIKVLSIILNPCKIERKRRGKKKKIIKLSKLNYKRIHEIFKSYQKQNVKLMRLFWFL